MKERESQQISKADQRKRTILVHVRKRMGNGVKAEIVAQILRSIMQ